MNKREYAQYEAAVAAFFEKEGINCLSGGHPYHDECQRKVFDLPDGSERDGTGEWDDSGKCVDCGMSRESYNQPFFSGAHCDCCGTSMAGNREHASGYNPTTQEIQEYTVCEDCIYYAAYGVLDDMTMLSIDEDTED